MRDGWDGINQEGWDDITGEGYGLGADLNPVSI